ncbi:hypothetical protein AJ80_01414 [Polytolypa hystricis UAMH7299]|uniref:G-patch domain-containing protein n=1 Tax=Polytolypa hystricis (strain UAMH7299) TaxID=1447883 RepID=A0A2B7YS28_POLH7|nr:hypothetical protein AJ80_01414 [Polytolypa hystricis UAMH7299]
MSYDDDDEYFLPLEDQRVFGAGVRRKRVKFIPSSETHLTSTSTTHIYSDTPRPTSAPPSSTTSARSVADTYLSIVLGSSTSSKPSKKDDTASTPPTSEICEICNLPLSTTSISSSQSSPSPREKPHESSLAHQVCLPHSHPPSALDRTRQGFKYLSAQGWDPDSRLGLGAKGQGIREPVKVRIKDDKLGLGLRQEEKARVEKRRRERAQMLNAKQVRRLEEERRRKGEKLREMFYGGADVEKYLGD